ncbi:MAG: nucleotidyltransferase family protein [Candidatus Omnitrophica bacterium]|nr:nucleotidyltransferase family protein [Candidatus Omnitrophota bacterium]
MHNIRPLFLHLEDTIRTAIATIQRGAIGIALVVDVNDRLVATMTDGDVRRAILGEVDLNQSLHRLLASRPEPYRTPIVAPVNTPEEELLGLLQEKRLRHIPLLDTDGRVVELALLSELIMDRPPKLAAVVMAGGLGQRLRPLTEDVPKPMLLVGDRPLLELIIEQLSGSGIHKVNITTHYKPEKITEHFGDGRTFGVELNYVNEEQPLGTAGALGLMKESEEPLLVINGDILTRIDFRALLAYHHDHQADLTVAVRKYDLKVPYGVIECDGPMIRRLREKPVVSFFVNAGVYLLQPGVRRLINNGERLDMTDLIQRLLDAGRPVVSFPVLEYWLDIGQLADYEQAQEDLRKGKL